MVRRASGGKVLDRAKRLVVEAKTVDELRQAQAVLLPLEFSLNPALSIRAWTFSMLMGRIVREVTHSAPIYVGCRNALHHWQVRTCVRFVARSRRLRGGRVQTLGKCE